MLTALALAAALAGPTTVDLIPSDDIWVYPHASDPQRDAYLRVWGAEGKDVAKDINEMQDYSYSYLKWDLSSLPAGKLKSATLVVTHVGGAGYNLSYAKQNPLRARPLSSGFSEKTWDYAKAEQVLPDASAKTIFGSGAPDAIPAEKEFTITVDLLKGPGDFGKYLDGARSSASKSIAMALTATMDVEEMGQKCIYKFYSKDCETASKRPVLHLTFEQ